eukprot:840005_1
MAQEFKEPQVQKPKRKKKYVRKKDLIQDVSVHDEVIDKANLVYKNKLKYAVYKLNDNETQIILDSVSPKENALETLNNILPDNAVRWIILSLSYKLKDKSDRIRILFISWIPDTIKRKTHKETIRVKSLGIFHQAHLMESFKSKSMKQIQANDHSDLNGKDLLQSVSSYGEQVDFESLWK